MNIGIFVVVSIQPLQVTGTENVVVTEHHSIICIGLLDGIVCIHSHLRTVDSASFKFLLAGIVDPIVIEPIHVLR